MIMMIMMVILRWVRSGLDEKCACFYVVCLVDVGYENTTGLGWNGDSLQRYRDKGSGCMAGEHHCMCFG